MLSTSQTLTRLERMVLASLNDGKTRVNNIVVGMPLSKPYFVPVHNALVQNIRELRKVYDNLPDTVDLTHAMVQSCGTNLVRVSFGCGFFNKYTAERFAQQRASYVVHTP